MSCKELKRVNIQWLPKTKAGFGQSILCDGARQSEKEMSLNQCADEF